MKRCQRLYENLTVKNGKRQFLLSGKTSDCFCADAVRGVCGTIEAALLYYAIQQGYEIAFAIDEKMTLHFATPQMREKYENIITQQSVDPQKTTGSVKRGQTAAPPKTAETSTVPTSTVLKWVAESHLTVYNAF